MNDVQSDVLVIGAGPAGLLVSALLARGGYRVTVVERDEQPRGGLLILTQPGQAAFGDLGWTARIRELSGAHDSSRLVLESDRERIVLDEYCPILAVPRAETVQQFCGEAERLGVELRLGSTAAVPILDGQRVVGVRVREGNGREYKLLARIVVDASGAGSYLAATFGLLLPRRGPRRQRLETELAGEAPKDLVLGLVDRHWFQLSAAGGGRLSAVLREVGQDNGSSRFPEPATELRKLESGARCRLAGSGPLAELSCSGLPMVIVGEGWLAVGEAAGCGAPGIPGATSRGLAVAASAASEIDYALQRRQTPPASWLGATVTLARRALHPESLLDRSLARAADMGALAGATATPWRRRTLSEVLRGRWDIPRTRLGRILYLWRLDRYSRAMMRKLRPRKKQRRR